jgi:SAM-dependent methyltransferase
VPSSIGIEPSEAERAAAAVARVLPRSLAPAFDARFVRSDRLLDEYVSRLAQQVLAGTVEEAVAAWGSPEEIIARAGLDAERSAVPLTWILRRLAERGVVEVRATAGGSQYRAERLPASDPDAVLETQRRHDPAALPSYTLASTAADTYPGFLRGTRSGEEILLAPARLALWNAYFSNDHPLYAVNNRVGAAALAAWLGPGPHTVLELGAGMGSGTTAALEALRASGRLGELQVYRVTDVVPTFLRYAERRVRAEWKEAPAVTFEKVDMNGSFREHGVEPASVSCVYAVNTLHVAHDLADTLGAIHETLRPGGQLIVSECVRPRPGQTLYPEFVFNMLTTFRAPKLHPIYRPNGGFLTPEQWQAAFEAAGFVGVRAMPDVPAIRDEVPYFSVAALGATRSA